MTLRKFRESVELSQEAFARKLGLSLSMQVQVESGRVRASRGYMDRLKRVYPKVSIDDLFFSKKGDE